MIRSVGLLLRLAGSGAPEHDQPFGQRSQQSLVELAFRKAAARSESEVFAGRCGAKPHLRRDSPRGKRRGFISRNVG